MFLLDETFEDSTTLDVLVELLPSMVKFMMMKQFMRKMTGKRMTLNPNIL